MKPRATDAGRLTRRRFLSAGLLAGSLAGSLALGGGLLFWPRSVPPGVDGESRRWQFLSPANAQAVIVLAPALLGPTASAALIASPARRYMLADGVDQAICLLTPGTRDVYPRLTVRLPVHAPAVCPAYRTPVIRTGVCHIPERNT